MGQLRTSPAAKVITFLLAVLLLTGGLGTSLFTLSRWDDVWSDGDYYSSASCRGRLYESRQEVIRLLYLTYIIEHGRTLSYLEQQEMDALTASLSARNTNLRYRVVQNATGEEVLTNLSTGTIDGAVHTVYRDTRRITEWESLGNDNQVWDAASDTSQIHVATLEGTKIFAQGDPEAAAYGWQFDGQSWYYTEGMDSRQIDTEYAIEYGVANPLVAEDAFRAGARQYEQYGRYVPMVAVIALVLDLLGLMALMLLCAFAGHRRGTEGYSLTGLHRLPTDLLAALEALLIAIILGGGDGLAFAFNQNPTGDALAGLIVLSVIAIGSLVGVLYTCAARFKTNTFFSNTLVWRFCRGVWQAGRSITAHWPVTRRTVFLFLLYLVGTVLTTFAFLLIPFYQGFVLWCLCRWVRQWRAVRVGTAQIVGGNPDYRIETEGMHRDLKEHALQLNDLGSAISSAVDERLKSERFKTELITNVSHDLKTPLTSIINYVDLLKKEELENPRAAEYIEVLDRKSQRLKKLTEDLVEASKASTGSLTVTRERLDMTQLVRQGVGEFAEKFAQKHLEPVLTLPEEALWVDADGRHLWRVLDNLFTNCYKYALEHTRIYLDLQRWEGNVTLSVKNISSTPLNIPPEQLMERFVRGEESRSTDGSGLGLSIARSLTELQGGTFRLSIDGDLFKAVVSLPQAAPPAPGTGE